MEYVLVRFFDDKWASGTNFLFSFRFYWCYTFSLQFSSFSFVRHNIHMPSVFKNKQRTSCIKQLMFWFSNENMANQRKKNTRGRRWLIPHRRVPKMIQMWTFIYRFIHFAICQTIDCEIYGQYNEIIQYLWTFYSFFCSISHIWVDHI